MQITDMRGAATSVNDSFTLRLCGVSIEKGAPAEACGELKSGQIIESINGRTMKDIDPRIILADLITEAEAKE